MNTADLARRLVYSSRDEREAIMRSPGTFPAVETAEALQAMCYEAWTDDPQLVGAICETVEQAADVTGITEVRGYAWWTSAIRSLVNGDLIDCVAGIERSEKIFRELHKPHLAAKTQTAKIYALALLGRYDEAVECGHRALEVFLAHGDLYSAGKVEHNVGNLFWRRDLYRESEPYLNSAIERFSQINDQRQLAMVENCQAFVKTLQNQFREAEPIYQRALGRALSNDLIVTAAEIETGLSNLYLFEGRYDLALKYMEQSRQRYEQLAMLTQSTICELEIADIYLELNLLSEAARYYERCGPVFERLGMRAELARCSLNHARVKLRQGDTSKAAELLDDALQLFHTEGNKVAQGSVILLRAQMLMEAGELDAAERAADEALSIFLDGENPRLEMLARWLRAEVGHLGGNSNEAAAELSAMLDSDGTLSRQVRYLCHLSLGRITGDEKHFKAAVDIVEDSRCVLASDELRMSFFADRVAPYNELVKINLDRGEIESAFKWHERSRSRTLSENVGLSGQPNGRAAELRDELNRLYLRINRAAYSSNGERARSAGLRKLAADLEREYAEVLRRSSSMSTANLNQWADTGIAALQKRLDNVALIEYAILQGRLSAFVVTGDQFTVVSDSADEIEISREVRQLLFQIGTGRIIDRMSDTSRVAAIDRLRHHGRRLYDLLIRPMADHIGDRSLVIAPSGVLHYLPFHALVNGDRYLVEGKDISYVPAASVLLRCLDRPKTDISRALVVGVPDIRMPMIADEVKAVADRFGQSVCLFGNDVTLENIMHHAAAADVIHMACHGKYRPDNPAFSSLTLACEELTLNDLHNLPFENSIIVLSACESGLNEVVRGDELVGLSRAFFAAGATSLVLTLWRVNDETTLELMRRFYSGLCNGMGPAAALCSAQRDIIQQGMHPYFWAPFTVSGRW
jgi:CHAT domain-containing protein